jgi:hypothetical protein
MGFSPGDFVRGKYRLDHKLGQGGLGEVWVATDVTLHRQVAIKFILGAHAIEPAERDRLLREAQAAATVAHPNIVVVHGVDVDNDPPFLEMELLTGPSLARRLGDGPFRVDEAIAVAQQVARGLDHAHRVAGLVHRDIKPSNLVFDGHGNIKIIDFGIARFHRAAAGTASQTSHGAGTPHYGAPEQFVGRWEDVDARADLYSLGCVLFEMLTGRPPFDSASDYLIIGQHVGAVPPSLQAVRPDIPPVLDRLVADLLAKHPHDRPGSAARVLSRLESIQAPGASQAWIPLGRTQTLLAPASRVSPAARTRWLRTRLVPAVTLAVLLVIYLGTAAAAGWFPFKSSPTAASLQPGALYFTNGDSGYCLDEDYYDYIEHPNVLAYPCDYNSNEIWQVRINSNGTYTLANGASTKCLTQGRQGQGIVVSGCSRIPAQEWEAVQDNGGTYLVNKGTGACLTQEYADGSPQEDLRSVAPCQYGPQGTWQEQH